MYDDDFLARLTARLREALPRWGVGPDAALRLLTISENATFLADEDGRRIVFRVHRPDYHTLEEIRSELAWIEALRADGVAATPEPLRMRDGELLGAFEDEGSLRHVVAFEHMSGGEPEPGEDMPHWYRTLGTITAGLHGHVRGWRTPAGFRRKLWDFDAMLGDRPLWGDWREGLGLEPEARALIERASAVLRREVEAYGAAPERFGLIHADLRPANLLVDGDRLGVIDFDDCGFSWFMYDFAAAVSFMEHEPFIPELQDAWLEGYAAVAPVSREERAIMPTFLLLRRILLTAWVASHAETPTAQSMGVPFTHGTLELAERHLVQRG
ncbi:phosphotransferase enzyme family protein [Methylopila sp. Yamaguchi]|uniref:phosphotransferase enzyme family protein n=1 Tax=Methylopila sp. Yamaguchi TaxID=1437817 RepID=UPI000CBE7AB2|nr:phosphotransferase [Methylopila sp. Yamaguchi]GBD48031.1 aminoglycoside phosphotransferase [Methylopila sp. Yamaguchi]